MSGKLYALSTGPGAADLITVRRGSSASWMCCMRQPVAKAATAWPSPSCASTLAHTRRSAAAIFR